MKNFSNTKNYRELWFPDLIVLLVLTITTFIAFYDKRIDIWAASFFHHPENTTAPWYEAKFFLWDTLYHSATWIGGVLLFGCITILAIAHFNSSFKKFRIYALYLFLVMSLGSGLLVNTFFKPYWGRPRPREVVELGGKREYRPFYAIGVGLPGKSFPCGHCTVCFTYGVFWWIFRRKNKWLRYTSLLISVAFGGLMGMARMSDGGHFFSDIIWSGLIVGYTGFFIYYFILKVPEYEDNPHLEIKLIQKLDEVLEGRRIFVFSIFSILVLATIAVLLLASPYYKEINLTIPIQNFSIFNISIDQSDIDFKVDPNLKGNVIISGTTKGFGFPTSETKLDCINQKELTLCTVKKIGFFTDYESNLKISVNPNYVRSLKLNLLKGNITILPPSILPNSYKINSGI